MRNRKIRPDRVMKEAERLKKLKRKPVTKEFLDMFLKRKREFQAQRRRYYWGSDEHQMALPLYISKD
jgi:hypothetical protein